MIRRAFLGTLGAMFGMARVGKEKPPKVLVDVPPTTDCHVRIDDRFIPGVQSWALEVVSVPVQQMTSSNFRVIPIPAWSDDDEAAYRNIA